MCRRLVSYLPSNSNTQSRTFFVGANSEMSGGATKERIRGVLRDVYGHSSFRSGQLDAASAILNGQDVVVRMTTSSGKSLCYQLPTMAMKDKCCIVISPLNSLMNDQVLQCV